MNDPTTILLGEIEALDDASVVEAAQLLAATLGADPSSDILDPDLKDHPMEHRADIVDLSCLLLMAAATDLHTQPFVSESIAGVGRKNLILGGAELVIIAGLAVNALQICLSKGMTSKVEEVKIEQWEDGTSVASIQSRVTYGVSDRLATLIRSVIRSVGDGMPSGDGS
jgi:hypothetical protein